MRLFGIIWIVCCNNELCDIRNVLKKSELEFGCVRHDAYSRELINLMMNYDKQLQGIFQKEQ